MAQAPEKKAEKSYLSSAVDSINPWAAGRGSNPTQQGRSSASSPTPPSVPPADRPKDHSTNPLYGSSWASYPKDCPSLNVLWFHAVDVRSCSNILGISVMGQHRIADERSHAGPETETKLAILKHK